MQSVQLHIRLDSRMFEFTHKFRIAAEEREKYHEPLHCWFDGKPGSVRLETLFFVVLNQMILSCVHFFNLHLSTASNIRISVIIIIIVII